jgi:hypothetical protein
LFSFPCTIFNQTQTELLKGKKMKNTHMYGIAFALALTTLGVSANEDSQALRDEINALNQRLDALEKQSPSIKTKSNWTDRIKIKGDIRYRFQFVEAEDTSGTNLHTTKNLQRIRARLGVFAKVNDFTTAGLGIRTGQKANSGNVTLGDHFDGLDLSISLAYFTIAPADSRYGSATLGKMKQPWKNSTDLIWDSDVNPEGIAYAYSGNVSSNTALFGSLGYFRVEENKALSDLNLGSLQVGLSQSIGKTKLTLGTSFYGYDNTTEFTDPVLPGNYAVDYRIAEGFAELGLGKTLPLPVKLYGNYVNNTAIGGHEDDGYCIGIKLGNAKKGKWEAKYDYRDLGLYAAPAYFTDSDFADGGTGIDGHRIKAKYNIAKNLAIGATYIYSKRTPARTLQQNQQFNTLMLDLMAKF